MMTINECIKYVEDHLEVRYATSNGAYTSGQLINKPEGCVNHSVGCAQPSVDVFFSTMNKSSCSWGMNALIGDFHKGEGRVLLTLKEKTRPWGCGPGNKGSWNNTKIQWEVCEPAGHTYAGGTMIGYDVSKNQEYFNRMWKLLVAWNVYCVKKFGYPISGVNDHTESYKAGFGSNHADMGQWLPKHGKSMDALRAEVKEIVSVGQPSTSGLQAKELINSNEENIISKIGTLFTADQKVSGVLASVSLAQFILESGYGKSELAQNANNCFGMKASLSGNTWPGSVWGGEKYSKDTQEFVNGKYITVKADFRKYQNIEQSIADHSAYLLGAMNGGNPRYQGLKGCCEYKKAFQIIKDGGYATSPTYVEKLCAVVEKWNLTKFNTPSEPQPPTTTPTPPTESNDYPSVPFTVDIIVPDLNFRSNPSMSGTVNGQTGKGIFTIVQVEDGWGKLKSGAGWIWLENQAYCKVQSSVVDTTTPTPYRVRVEITNLNIRRGPGVNYTINGQAGSGVYTIVEESAGEGSDKGWGKLKSGAGWISLDHVTKTD